MFGSVPRARSRRLLRPSLSESWAPRLVPSLLLEPPPLPLPVPPPVPLAPPEPLVLEPSPSRVTATCVFTRGAYHSWCLSLCGRLAVVVPVSAAEKSSSERVFTLVGGVGLCIPALGLWSGAIVPRICLRYLISGFSYDVCLVRHPLFFRRSEKQTGCDPGEDQKSQHRQYRRQNFVAPQERVRPAPISERRIPGRDPSGGAY